MKLTPADYVIKQFGGVRATARAIGRTPSSISKWRTRISKQGIKGGIPSSVQSVILKQAKKLKLNIQPHDLIGGTVTHRK